MLLINCQSVRIRWGLTSPRWIVAAWLLAGSAPLATALAQVPADENPFGLPAPNDPAHIGAVMLHGGGNDPLSDEIRHEFVRLAGGRDARIVLIPSDQAQRGKDPDGNPLATAESGDAYLRRLALPKHYGRWAALDKNKEVADFQFLIQDETADPDDRRFYQLLENATGVWLPAYDQAWLPDRFAHEDPNRASRFQLALDQVVARGGVVGGLGGGMSSLPETVITEDEPREDGGWIRAKLGFGLGLIKGAVVDQNFDIHPGRLERLTDLLRSGPRLNRLAGTPGVERRTIGVGVERQTVAILQGNAARVMGEGRVHFFLKSNGDRTITWRTLAPGEGSLTLRTGSARPSTQADKSALAHDDNLNPFGIPTPDDPQRLGTVILHGGGDTDELIDLFPTLCGVPSPRLVHCPAARDSCRPSAELNGKALDDHIEESFAQWRQLEAEGRAADLSFVTTGTRLDANRVDFVKPITRADGMWFCGGDQAPLSELFVDSLRPTLFQQAVQGIVRRGGVVGGSSAGLAIMADVMIESGDPTDSQPAVAELSHGLGLMTRVLAEQHFDARGGRIERLTGLLRDHRRLANFSPTTDVREMIGLAVEEDTALVARGNRLRIIGRKQAHVFLQSDDPRVVVWHALKSGDAAVVWHRPSGYFLELEDWEFAE